MPPTEIAVPFRVDGDGRVVTVSDPDRLVRQHVSALVNTQPTERAMVPGYGVDTHGLLFEDVDGEDLAESATNLITSALFEWEPGVRLNRIAVDPDTEGSFSKIDIDYSRKDAADSGMVANANEAIIGVSGAVREIVRG